MKLRRSVTKDDKPVGWVHYCPGCRSHHLIWVEQPNSETGARWTFDGNLEAPTFSPSVVCFHYVGADGKFENAYDENGKRRPDAVRKTDCHYFLRAGQLQFCSDSPHHLAGQTVPLPELPDP